MSRPASKPDSTLTDQRSAQRRQTLAEYRALGYQSPPKAAPILRGRSVSAVQAAVGSEGLGALLRQAQDAQSCLRELRSVLPPTLLALVKSGPIEAGCWTLLVAQPTAAAKIRQWAPALQAHVRTKGWPVTRIEVKVHRP